MERNLLCLLKIWRTFFKVIYCSLNWTICNIFWTVLSIDKCCFQNRAYYLRLQITVLYSIYCNIWRKHTVEIFKKLCHAHFLTSNWITVFLLLDLGWDDQKGGGGGNTFIMCQYIYVTYICAYIYYIYINIHLHHHELKLIGFFFNL